MDECADPRLEDRDTAQAVVEDNEWFEGQPSQTPDDDLAELQPCEYFYIGEDGGPRSGTSSCPIGRLSESVTPGVADSHIHPPAPPSPLGGNIFGLEMQQMLQDQLQAMEIRLRGEFQFQLEQLREEVTIQVTQAFERAGHSADDDECEEEAESGPLDLSQIASEQQSTAPDLDSSAQKRDAQKVLPLKREYLLPPPPSFPCLPPPPALPDFPAPPLPEMPLLAEKRLGEVAEKLPPQPDLPFSREISPDAAGTLEVEVSDRQTPPPSPLVLRLPPPLPQVQRASHKQQEFCACSWEVSEADRSHEFNSLVAPAPGACQNAHSSTASPNLAAAKDALPECAPVLGRGSIHAHSHAVLPPFQLDSSYLDPAGGRAEPEKEPHCPDDLAVEAAAPAWTVESSCDKLLSSCHGSSPLDQCCTGPWQKHLLERWERLELHDVRLQMLGARLEVQEECYRDLGDRLEARISEVLESVDRSLRRYKFQRQMSEQLSPAEESGQCQSRIRVGMPQTHAPAP